MEMTPNLIIILDEETKSTKYEHLKQRRLNLNGKQDGFGTLFNNVNKDPLCFHDMIVSDMHVS